MRYGGLVTRHHAPMVHGPRSIITGCYRPPAHPCMAPEHGMWCAAATRTATAMTVWPATAREPVDNWCNRGTSPCADGLLCDKTSDRCSECLKNGHCDDGVACNGAEACIDGACVVGTSPCSSDKLCDKNADLCVFCLEDESSPRALDAQPGYAFRLSVSGRG